MKDCITNQEIFEDLKQIVFDLLGKKGVSRNSIQAGKLEINDFSICFRINYKNGTDLDGVYVKIPKAHMYMEKQRNISPITESDRKLANAEYESLKYLCEHWPNNNYRIRFIKPLLFIPDYNAIITKRELAENILKYFRRADLSGRLGNFSLHKTIHEFMFNLGDALSIFHSKSIEEEYINYYYIINKINEYGKKIAEFGSDERFINDTLSFISIFKDTHEKISKANTLKGLDIRNILIDENHNFFILDPGKLKRDCIEADIARFLVTIRILYWGSLWFFLRMAPSLSFENKFLQGYYGEQKRNSVLLSMFIIKELFKHWCQAHVVLSLKPWPSAIKYFLKVAYITPFYKGQIDGEIKKLEVANEQY